MLVKAVTRAGQSSRARSVQCSAAARRHEIRPIEFANHARRQALAKWPGIRKLRTTRLLPDSVGGRNSTFDISVWLSHIPRTHEIDDGLRARRVRPGRLQDNGRAQLGEPEAERDFRLSPPRTGSDRIADPRSNQSSHRARPAQGPDS